jgi:hypothetical protein
VALPPTKRRGWLVNWRWRISLNGLCLRSLGLSEFNRAEAEAIAIFRENQAHQLDDVVR